MLRVGVPILLVAAPCLAGSWTQLVVLSGDFSSARAQLEAVRETDDSPFTVVLHDPPAVGDTRAYRPHYCPSKHRSVERCTAGGAETIPLASINPAWSAEVDLGDADTLASALAWVAGAAPSEHILVTLKGRSRFGHILRDDDAGDNAGLTVSELRRALQPVPFVDVLVLASSASASIEIAAALRDRVGLLVATQESTGDGRLRTFRLSRWQAMLRDQPAVSPRELARQIAFNVRDPSYSSFHPQVGYAVSVLDVEVAAEVADRFADDCERLLERGDAGIDQLERATEDVWRYGGSQTRADLGGVLTRLEASDDRAAEPLGLRTRLALRAAVVDSYGSPDGGPTGLSIFFPADLQIHWDLREEYRSRFGPVPHETGWQRLLRARLKLARDRAAGCTAVLPPPLLVLWLGGWLLRRKAR